MMEEEGGTMLLLQYCWKCTVIAGVDPGVMREVTACHPQLVSKTCFAIGSMYSCIPCNPVALTLQMKMAVLTAETCFA